MERNEVRDKVVQIIHDQLGVEREKITEDAKFMEDLKADSLDIVELVMEFEDQFDISIPDDEAQKIQTVGQAVDYILKTA
ncbi:MAG: acyl carrier protein [Planctomycetes bacterium]|nr:acyl carrier protein [Planctomycetota bacterium]